ncbi:hypothetical protein BGW36DRAFT_428470 [Talaromyces proteolyticus]|uniref:Uncharacterized protein n=1 Tax=Talaromyces proteolyticus TaxID=1131652 RepID=A0AAD4KTW2_9EURO|nr:uncharacterized protein BGW36DRAFT_428470 [Talaromyces proteolyticus]KAH8696461.1 hypothetical protein BGW36DRAFT_428470 [Talaromyces proteolyticus]
MASEHIRKKLDKFWKQTDARPGYRSVEFSDMVPYRRRKGRRNVPIETIIQKLQDEVNGNASRESSSTPLPLSKAEMLLRSGVCSRQSITRTLSSNNMEPSPRKIPSQSTAEKSAITSTIQPFILGRQCIDFNILPPFATFMLYQAAAMLMKGVING